jgi:putative membrane protein
MDFDHMDGPGWALMSIAWLTMLTLIGLVAWFSTRTTSTTKADPVASAHQILAERYARGEIDDDEYHRRTNRIRR